MLKSILDPTEAIAPNMVVHPAGFEPAISWTATRRFIRTKLRVHILPLQPYRMTAEEVIIECMLKSTPMPPIYTKDVLIGPDYTIGEYTYGVPTILKWQPVGRLIIGKFSCIAAGVTLMLNGDHPTDCVSSYTFKASGLMDKHVGGPRPYKHSIRIGNDVWLGQNVTILPGVTIGDGAVIGACAVVTKDVEPYTIVGGNPASVIRKRFSDEVIEQLLQIAWWNWPEEKIRENVEILTDDPEELLAMHPALSATIES